MGMALAAVADHGHLLVLDQVDVAVAIVIDPHASSLQPSLALASIARPALIRPARGMQFGFWRFAGRLALAHGACNPSTPRRPTPPPAAPCAPVDRSTRPTRLPPPDLAAYRAARAGWTRTRRGHRPAARARAFRVPAGHFFRIVCTEGPQVGDLNLWSAADLAERFFSGKTRALHGTHLSTGDRLWSCLPYLRPMATITEDTLDWYGFDGFGGRVHDVIGTRCDPYTHRLLSGGDYHHCCHSNLTRALAPHRPAARRGRGHVHDVLNVFMCTGFTRDTGQYFMKASPVRPGDFSSSSPRSTCSARSPPVRAATARPSIPATPPPAIRCWSRSSRRAAPPAGWTPPARNGYPGGHGA